MPLCSFMCMVAVITGQGKSLGADGYAIWRRIMQAVEGLSATEPGGKVN